MIQVVHVVDGSLTAAARQRLRVLLERLPADRFAQRVHERPIRVFRSRERSLFPSRDRQGAVRGASSVGPPLPDGRGSEMQRVYHAWGMRALTACRMHSDVRAVLSLDAPPTDPRGRRLLAALLSERVAVVTGGQAARRGFGQCGSRPEQIVVVRGPVDFAAINAARRANLRGQIVGDARGPVILTSGPATRAGGQFRAAWAAAILRQIHAGVRLIVPFASAERDRARRLLVAAGTGAMWVEPPGDWGWAELNAVADVFVDAAEEAGPTEPIAWAMAAGVPVVGTAIRSTAELIADRHNGLLVREGSPRALAAAMLTVTDDAGLRKNLTETARGQAYEVFSVREFVDNMGQVYENIVEGRAASESVRDTAMAG